MQIDIDFDVFKALTALRQNESDSYNAVVRRLLNLSSLASEPSSAVTNALLRATSDEHSQSSPPARDSLATKGGIFGLASAEAPEHKNALGGLLGRYTGGIWLGNSHFPEGTRFRATYKGQTYFAEIHDGKWIGQDRIARNSPSDAASAITGNNVNGWRFWSVQMPEDPAWRKLDEFRS